VDFASIIVYGDLNRQIPELIFAQAFQLGFSAFWGIIYAYLLTKTSKHHYLFKGIFYGTALWGAIYIVAMLYRVPELRYTSLQTAISNYISAAIFGGILAGIYKRLESD
jgi:hypothetical protein